MEESPKFEKQGDEIFITFADFKRISGETELSRYPEENKIGAESYIIVPVSIEGWMDYDGLLWCLETFGRSNTPYYIPEGMSLEACGLLNFFRQYPRTDEYFSILQGLNEGNGGKFVYCQISLNRGVAGFKIRLDILERANIEDYLSDSEIKEIFGELNQELNQENKEKELKENKELLEIKESLTRLVELNERMLAIMEKFSKLK